MPTNPTNPGVHVEKIPAGVHAIAGVSTSTAAFVGTTMAGQANKPGHCLSELDYQRSFGGLDPASEVSYAIQQFFANGGKDAIVVRIDDVGLPGPGLRALDEADSFNLLCLPGISAKGALHEAVSLCRRRRAFFVVDAPLSVESPDGMLALVASAELPKDDHAALYYPWIDVPDPLRPGQWRRSAPSGTVAGLYARVDIREVSGKVRREPTRS